MINVEDVKQPVKLDCETVSGGTPDCRFKSIKYQ
jgi:hypothetical protein